MKSRPPRAKRTDTRFPYATLFRSSGERLSMKWRMRRADGVYRWMAASAEAMRDQGGHIAQWYGLCHDIDDQLQAEEALRKREQELLQLVDALPVQIWSWTTTGKLAFVNKRYLEDLGLAGAKSDDDNREIGKRASRGRGWKEGLVSGC